MFKLLQLHHKLYCNGFINVIPVQLDRIHWPHQCGTTTGGPRFVSSKSILNQKTHYEILDVQRSASALEIREAFLKLSKEYHPDINANDPENHQKFILLNEAYTVLSKPLSRRDYDLTLQFERQVRQHQNYSAYRSHGYQADNPYYHYRHNVDWDGMSQPSQEEHNDKFHKGRRLFRILVNYYSLTACFTIGFVTFVLMGKELIVPDARKSTLLQNDINNHDFIMTCHHEGRTVSYYAVQQDENPENFKIIVVAKKNSDDEQSSECEMEELNPTHEHVSLS